MMGLKRMAEHEKRFDPQRRAVLTGAERWKGWNPPKLLTLAGAQQGFKAVDMGCGSGFFTLPLADLVGPTGLVTALDVSRELLDELAGQKPPGHVRVVQGELPRVDLPDAAFDFVWVAFVFHEVEPPAALAKEMRRVLRAGGVAAVLDWRPDATGEGGPPRHHRLSSDQVRRHLEAAGFSAVMEKWRDDDAYLVQAY